MENVVAAVSRDAAVSSASTASDDAAMVHTFGELWVIDVMELIFERSKSTPATVDNVAQSMGSFPVTVNVSAEAVAVAGAASVTAGSVVSRRVTVMLFWPPSRMVNVLPVASLTANVAAALMVASTLTPSGRALATALTAQVVVPVAVIDAIEVIPVRTKSTPGSFDNDAQSIPWALVILKTICIY